jgi:PhzF family phenazine biosynthesis protein
MPEAITVLHYTAFSEQPEKGNPAGIVLAGEDLSEKQMQEIARQVGYNETTFICRSVSADLRLRYFTPGYEMSLCGHGTIAAFYALKTRKMLETAKETFQLETLAGLLPIQVQELDGQVTIWMQQAPAEFRPFVGSSEDIASAIGLSSQDIETSLPILYGSTGTWTLLVPIRTLAAFERMRPQNSRFPEILTALPRASIHPFCLETYDLQADMHARHFSSPYAGTIEDPVTGTASGVMGAYYSEYIERKSAMRLLIEQGFEVGRDGRVLVDVSRTDQQQIEVRIAGTAAYIATTQLLLSDS